MAEHQSQTANYALRFTDHLAPCRSSEQHGLSHSTGVYRRPQIIGRRPRHPQVINGTQCRHTSCHRSYPRHGSELDEVTIVEKLSMLVLLRFCVVVMECRLVDHVIRQTTR